MALIVEDGTGLSTAESYTTVAEADAYHEKRGNTTWDAIDDKEALLRKATDFMLGRYGSKWFGSRVSSSQALDWPRINVPMNDYDPDVYYSSESVPQAIKNACAALALKANSADLLADQKQKVVSVQVGPISTTYDNSSSAAVKYPEVDGILRPFLRGGGSSAINMVRV